MLPFLSRSASLCVDILRVTIPQALRSRSTDSEFLILHGSETSFSFYFILTSGQRVAIFSPSSKYEFILTPTYERSLHQSQVCNYTVAGVV
jgi:hypothetical protein